ncbi:DUF2515 domain-containing protein [Bacillus lacus]|uniref:DUF2515 domain-containing protein n=1 Tax=Metabacillus lacus TaxID=1983721 RepID=A0A7X2LW09_9BACI|nr:DUF2515 family protein [Metabacillus lacus]MRX70955.1 DUF2515 domain-containing protein [Metabacillus lacus]
MTEQSAAAQEDREIVRYIQYSTKKRNYDNISRTESYRTYYNRNKDIQWSFLASMVSRNAGWCMTDLKGTWYRKFLSAEERESIFYAYEAANFLIFSDAYPQLLLYEYSLKAGKPFFYLLSHFNVSMFMVNEWNFYWKHQDKARLMTSLIINEQHVIQKPVLEGLYFKKHVFSTSKFLFQDTFHFSTVIFPVLHKKLYGITVNEFKNPKKRISLGKKLAWLLFHPLYYSQFKEFSDTVVHTGSRFDYERVLKSTHRRTTPMLRTAYGAVSTNIDDYKADWFHGQNVAKFRRAEAAPKKFEITDWYHQKQNQLHILALCDEYWKYVSHRDKKKD